MKMGMLEQPDDDRQQLNFAAVAQQHFSFLGQLGFSLIEASSTLVRYQRGDVEAAVYHGRQSFEIGLDIGRHGKSYSLGMLMRAKEPEEAKAYRNYMTSTQEGVAKGLVRLAELSKRYALRALADDSEFFAEVDRHTHSWFEAHAFDTTAAQLRPKAADAFRRGDYADAASLYEQFLPLLTPAEQKKLAIARKRASG